MDAFYASVEQLDNPSLKGKPVAVGGSRDRGVVAAASYEARAYGVKSAMPSSKAKVLCKDLTFVKPRFDRYKSISREIRNIFHDYTDIIEPLSLDEAFLDVTENKKNIPIARDIAREIRSRIYKTTGLTSSAGISINKFLAKVATEVNKPNGQKVIPPQKAHQFIDSLPIDKFFGVGKVTCKKMNNIGIYNGADLKKNTEQELIKHFGKMGSHFFRIARCIDNKPVNPNRERKSIGAEQTFSKDIASEAFILEKLHSIAAELEKRMIKTSNKGKTVTVKIKYSDFTQHTRSKTIENYISKKEEFFPIIENLIYRKKMEKSVRLLGISITNLFKEKKQDEQDPDLQMRFEFL